MFVVILISSPLFIQYIAFLKPDANVVLLCTISSLLLIKRYYENLNIKYLLFAILFASLGTAIKWWGIFLLFPISYIILIVDTHQKIVSISMKYFLYSVIGLAVVSFLLQFIIVHNIPQLLLDNGIDIYSDSYALKESITKKKIYQLIRFFNDYLGQSIIFIFFILFTIIYYRSINYLEKKKSKLFICKNSYY